MQKSFIAFAHGEYYSRYLERATNFFCHQTEHKVNLANACAKLWYNSRNIVRAIETTYKQRKLIGGMREEDGGTSGHVKVARKVVPHISRAFSEKYTLLIT